MKIIRTFLATVALCLCISSCNEHTPNISTTGVSLHSELGGSAAGFERACKPRQFSFPKDHGAHPTFRNEWWYITGNLENLSGERFGFHVTFFRIANQPATITDNTNNSNWLSNEFYMAHFAISTEDLVTKNSTDSAHSFERFSRAAAGLAGAQVNNSNPGTATVSVWLDDWRLQANDVDGELHWQLSIAEDDYALQLNLYPEKPLVLQGDAGYSQKSSDPCNASYYYSIPRLRAEGQITAKGRQHNASGTAWLDREWSSSALSAEQTGWDWFALQLNDGRDIMIYRLRLSDGSIDSHSYAVEMDSQGNKQIIPADNITIAISQWWQSPTGARYPIGGTIHRQDTNETVVFTPLQSNQELDLTVRYWEGAIELTGTSGKNIGHGYLELTGY